MITRGTYDFVRTLFGPLTAELFADVTGGVMDPHAPPAPRPRIPRSPRPARPARDPAQSRAARDAARAARHEGMQLARALRSIATLSGDTLEGFQNRLHGSTAEQLEQVRQAVRTARFRTHPDRNPGRTARDFLRVQSAAELLGRHYGVTL